MSVAHVSISVPFFTPWNSSLSTGEGSALSLSKKHSLIHGICLGELRCSCPFRRDVCHHLEAAAELHPFSPDMRRAAAELMYSHGLLVVTDSQQGLATCGSLVPDVPVATLNIMAGFCDCLDWASNGICAHLLVASKKLPQLPGSTLINEQDQQLDAHAAIKVQRTHLQPLPANVPEPCDAGAVAEANELRKHSSNARSVASALPDEARQLRACALRLTRVAGLVPVPVLQHVLPGLLAACTQLEAAVPNFKVLPVQERASFRRKEKHRKTVPLFDRRKRKAVVAGAIVKRATARGRKDTTTTLKKVTEPGRPRANNTRGPSNFIRNYALRSQRTNE